MPTKRIEDFGITYLQVLDENGKLDKRLEPKLSEEELLKLYRAMLLARRADERMLKLQRQGRLGTFGPSTGHEATTCGATFAMTERDWFAGAFRELGGRLMRGEPLANYLLFHNGFEEGNAFGADHRTLPFSIIVGAQLLHAVGVAYQIRYRKEKDAAVVVFMGDGATSQGDFHEALNFASVWQVPVVFVVQNNQWAISVPLAKQTHSRTIAQKAIAYDMPGVQVDGNDVLAVYRATREALDRAYAGQGPTLIESRTYRLMMHTTSDDPSRYRSEEEEKTWWAREPLIRFRGYIEKKGYWDEERQTALEADIKAEIDAAVGEMESRSNLRPEALFEHVYGTEHKSLLTQREEFLKWRS